MGADLGLDALDAGLKQRCCGLGGEVAGGDPGAARGQDHPGAGGHRPPDRLAHRLDAVGHKVHRVDHDVVLGQESLRQGAGEVLAIPAGTAVGDGDDGALDGRGQGSQALLDDGGLTHGPTVVRAVLAQVPPASAGRGGFTGFCPAPTIIRQLTFNLIRCPRVRSRPQFRPALLGHSSLA